MTRHFLRSISKLLIGVVLMAQMAVSAYACPGQAAKMQMSASTSAGNQADDATGPKVQQMAHCGDMSGAMDPSFANLCAEHCHQGQQSDHAATLTVPVAVFAALYITSPAPEPFAGSHPATDATSALVAASRPHTILHCCFRI